MRPSERLDDSARIVQLNAMMADPNRSRNMQILAIRQAVMGAKFLTVREIGEVVLQTLREMHNASEQ